MQTINDRMCAGRMDGIIFPDPDNCDSYVQCQGGEVTRRRCESGTLFDLNLYYCVSSHVVVCGTRRETFVPPVRPNNPGQGNPPSAESHHSVSEQKIHSTSVTEVLIGLLWRFVVIGEMEISFQIQTTAGLTLSVSRIWGLIENVDVANFLIHELMSVWLDLWLTVEVETSKHQTLRGLLEM